MASVEEFDAAPEPRADALLRSCCASRTWVAAMLAGRPYGSLPELTAAAQAAVLELAWPDVEEALAAHPRIGERPEGNGREAAWSRQEQQGAAAAEPETQAEQRRRNAEYEQRFGHVYLVCATGRSAADLLDDVTARLAHDAGTERDVVRRELAAIVELRLAKALA
jgi:2-oxo-4-hydroxy-4-carboxy-5-ureidoimidazoline decarboxylase